jgi:hypothetical protein
MTVSLSSPPEPGIFRADPVTGRPDRASPPPDRYWSDARVAEAQVFLIIVIVIVIVDLDFDVIVDGP